MLLITSGASRLRREPISLWPARSRIADAPNRWVNEVAVVNKHPFGLQPTGMMEDVENMFKCTY
jgi:hypothetical protein